MVNEKTNLAHRLHNHLAGDSTNLVLMKLMFAIELVHKGKKFRIPKLIEVTRYSMYYIRVALMPTMKLFLRNGKPKDLLATSIKKLYLAAKEDKENIIYDPNVTITQACLDFTESLIIPNTQVKFLNMAKSAMIRRIKDLTIEKVDYRGELSKINYDFAVASSDGSFVDSCYNALIQSETLHRSLQKLLVVMHIHLYGKKIKENSDGFLELDTPWAYQDGYEFDDSTMEMLMKKMITDILFIDVVSYINTRGIEVDGYFGDDPKRMLNMVKPTKPNIRTYLALMHGNLIEYAVALMDEHLHDIIKKMVDGEFESGFGQGGELTEQ